MSTVLRRSTLRTTSNMQALRAWRPAYAALRLTGTRICRRSYSESPSYLQLPPPEDWYHVFDRFEQDRAMLKRLDTARLVANSFLGDQSSVGGEGKVVIEAFPGTCVHDHRRIPISYLIYRSGCSIPRPSGVAPFETPQAHHPRGPPGLSALSAGASALPCISFPSSTVHTRH